MELGFHRKYRPTTLANYIGNAELKASVKAMLKQDTLPQVILMHGHAGTGKTTMARLLAKEYLCADRDEDEGACGKCYNCQLMDEFITTGQNPSLYNLQEVDITDSNKKQDIDSLLDDMNTASFDGNWKIYILDEVHTLSVAAQNRLLKTLEEPPERVLIILCTTNPEKLLETVLTRCQYKFQVKKPTREELVALLKAVCEAESVTYDMKALSLIAVRADFVPRRALIELENVIREVKEVTYAETAKLLNVVVDTYYFTFFELFTSPKLDILRYVNFIGTVKEKVGVNNFMQGLLPFLVRGIYVLNGVKVEGLDASELKVYSDLFKKFSLAKLAFLLDTFVGMANQKEEVVEIKLLNLGYSGLREKSASITATSAEVKVPTVAEEKSKGIETFVNAQNVTPEESAQLISDSLKPVLATEAFANMLTIDVES